MSQEAFCLTHAVSQVGNRQGWYGMVWQIVPFSSRDVGQTTNRTEATDGLSAAKDRLAPTPLSDKTERANTAPYIVCLWAEMLKLFTTFALRLLCLSDRSAMNATVNPDKM
ncbi:unnamed protein product [Protopolystoma xenopodis]|uniref:Uncharacterized protein n=1 Tax=Protopolystoma xenopodis TaxID=117903 RepID=A0A448WBQ3_9PLAT|nr:unnamed protein product [Protopolystoma xenopodis]